MDRQKHKNKLKIKEFLKTNLETLQGQIGRAHV